MRRAFCAVVLAALACLIPRAARVGLAGDYVDAIGRITAQDEALYSHSAIAMAEHGEWLTPRFMGRLALYKPPLLIWAAALSARLFGVSRLALRFPVMLIAACVIGLVFLWGAETSGVAAGICAALFLLGNHLFHTLSTLVMTDALLLAFTAGAVYALYADPWLESRAALWGFAAVTAGGILTKSIAGIFPLAILALYWIAVRRQERPALGRAITAAGLALALAAPWFLYQLAVHPRWFWTEHIAVEILGFGAGAPPQTSRENPVFFYFLRLAVTDPVLLSGLVVAIPSFVRALRARTAGPVLLACWISLTGAAALAWQYRNASYLLPLIPALALIAACYGAFSERRHAPWMLGFLAVAFVVKAVLPSVPWGLNYRDGTINPVASALSRYCQQAHGRSLVVVDVVDDLYATVLPIPRPTYTIIGPPAATSPYRLPFDELGIAVTVPQFLDLARLRPAYEARLREWDTSPAAPAAIASLISVRSLDELAQLIRATPDSDYLIPERYSSAGVGSRHVQSPASRGYLFLLSPSQSAPSGGNCRM